MKKWCVVFFVFMFLLVGVCAETQLSPTGTKDVSVSIAGSPLIVVLLPESGTYFSNESIMLEILHNADDLWYNLDDGPNITLLTNLINLNLEEGSYVLNVYGNNTYGETFENVKLRVDLAAYSVIYDKYKNKGETTDLESYPLESIQQIGGVVLEKEFGKITFNNVINITGDSIPGDNVTDIDSGVDVSFNRIELDSVSLPNFDVESTLILYDLNFANPHILRNGVTCPVSICTLNYYDGNLSFNVTGFSVYSAEETPRGDDSGDGSGGGSGGGRGSRSDPPAASQFKLSRESLRVELKQGEAKRDVVEIENTGKQHISFELNHSLGELVNLSEIRFGLNSGESKRVFIDLIAPKGKDPDLYLGEIVVKGDDVEKEIPVSVEISSEEALFDVRIEIDKEDLEILPGENLLADITIFSLGREGLVDTNLTFQIRNEEDERIIESEETLAVDVQSSFTREFILPRHIPDGNYVLYVNVKYLGQVGGASQWFVVKANSPIKNIPLWIYVVMATVVIILIVLANLRKWKEGNKTIKKNKRKRFKESSAQEIIESS